MYDQNASRLGSIKTYLLIALIFNILSVIGFAFGALLGLFLFIVPFVGVLLTFIFIIPFILSIISLTRVNQMRGAAERGDIAKLKELNSLGWAIVSLLFAGIITGIMLLIAHGSINDLTMTPQTAPVQQAAQAGMKFCANCGTQMPSSTAFCPKCGAKQPM